MVKDEFLRAQVVMLRGLGYNQKEISTKLGVSQSTVSYTLSEVNKTAIREGDESEYIKILSAGYSPVIVKAAKMLFKGRL